MSELYIGLMSGTSLDGIDAGLVDFSDNKIRLIAFHYHPFSADLRQQIQQISQPEQAIFLKDYGAIDCQLGRLSANAVLALLHKAQIPASAIKAIGSHGQTIYHAPDLPYSFTLQIADPNIIAETTGITTVADFRRRDLAVGGQGAPLVPAFHQAAFADPKQPRAIINIGGIANITLLDGDHVLGFDTGPGNTLMDYWHQQHFERAYDDQGDWAASGEIDHALVEHLLDDNYFRQAPPKSTGKEYFSPAWLQQKLDRFNHCKAADIQASLCQLSANSIADAIRQYASNSKIALLCGGGVHNRQLIKLLQEKTAIPILSTADYGIDPDHVEAIAFAWLARQTIKGLPGNVSSVTGAKAPVVLGGIYPGRY